MAPIVDCSSDGQVGTVALRGAHSFGAVRSFKAQLDDAASGDRDISIDLRELTGRQRQRSIGRLGPIVTNLLLRDDLQVRPLSVHPPATASPASQLARSGMFFALARHDSGLQVTSDRSALFSDQIQKWRHDWRAVAPRDALFDIAEANDANQPAEIGSRIVAFLNPSPSKIDVSSRQNAIYPWLREITKGNKKYTAETRQQMLREISIITTELLDNVVHHARASKSIMTLSGIETREPCLQMAVVDNGCGIANSLLDRGEKVDAVEYLAGLVTNRHSLRDMGRGDGIAKIARRTEKCGGTLLIASGPIPATGRSVVVDYDHPAGDRKNRVFEDDLGVQGTVAVVRIPLDPSRYSS
ncbi:ATP-binding protein [Mycolicibacterium sp. CBM1]